MNTPFIQLDQVSKSFGGVKSLIDVTLGFHAGEAVALAGENGSGKSTLIKILSGVHAPTSGRIVIDGAERSVLRPIDAVRAGVQVIFQDFSLFPNLSVEENIAFGRTLAGGERRFRPRAVAEIARQVLDRLQVDLSSKARVEDLPVVGKQLTAIARALASDARLIVMDEPSTALTDHEVRILLDIVARLKAGGVAVLFVSHKLQELFSVCDRVVVLRNGEKVSEGTTSEYTAESLTRHMTGRSVPESRPAGTADRLGKVALDVVSAGRGTDFDDVTLCVREGEVVGVAGRLGGGRTELAEALFGLGPFSRGTVRIRGTEVKIDSPQTAIRQGVAYVPEDRLSEGLFFGRSVAANVEAGLLGRFASHFGYVRKRAMSAAVNEWLRRLRVKAVPEQGIGTLSGGNQQRVVLARWLAQAPSILILNGPSVGVDVGSKADIHDAIRSFAASGLATLLISDDLSELVTCCDRVLVMKRGALTAEVASADLSEAALSALLAE